jgi:hypothetical protein
MAYETTKKFVKAHVNTTTNGLNGGVLYWMKLLYEFWGFCVNGTNDLRIPGGFAMMSGALAPNYLRMATGFESGSAVLLASGSDGSTLYGDTVFTAPSINWTSGSLLGKHVVTWRSSSLSTDDGIYQITKIVNSSSVILNVNEGATAMSGSLNQPRFESRTNVNFRVIDFAAACTLPSFAADDYMILQFNAPTINAGANYSQARIRLKSNSSTIDQGNISLSASGSWNGSSFSDLGPEVTPDDSTWNINGNSAFSFWADQGGVISHARTSGNSRAFFHIEVPTRLFPVEKDPNPICFVNVGGSILTTSAFASPINYSAGWIVHCPLDNVTARRHHILVRNISGIANSDLYGSTLMSTVSNDRYRQSFYNSRKTKFIVQDIILAHRITLNSYTMGRCQLRLAAFATGPFQTDTKLGSSGQWISITEGVLWPWNNTQLPNSLFPYGL